MVTGSLAEMMSANSAAVIKKFKGTSQKVRRAQILSRADADGPNWTDERIAEAFGCRTRTIEKLRQSGASVSGPVDGAHERRAELTDPAGNTLVLYQPR